MLLQETNELTRDLSRPLLIVSSLRSHDDKLRFLSLSSLCQKKCEKKERRRKEEGEGRKVSRFLTFKRPLLKRTTALLAAGEGDSFSSLLPA